MTDHATTTHRRPRRALLWAAGVTTAVAVIVSATLALMPGRAVSDEPRAQVPTAEIERGDLQGIKRVTGELRYVDERPLVDGVGGTITQLPAEGDVIDRGGALYAADNIPVTLLFGALPAWRDVAPGMADGPDVRQLEDNLRALGFFDREPDDEFTWATERAIRAWQKATGQEQTGTIALGRVVFAPGPVRIGALEVRLGDRVSGPIGTISETERIVGADLALGDQSLAVAGAAAQVILPGNVTTTGVIDGVGAPVERDTATGKITVVPVTIRLDDPAAAGDLQRGSVGVELISRTAVDVLSVPLQALVATGSGEFAVQVLEADGALRTVAVQTGLFAGGRVEVSGDLEAGQQVVIPAL